MGGCCTGCCSRGTEPVLRLESPAVGAPSFNVPPSCKLSSGRGDSVSRGMVGKLTLDGVREGVCGGSSSTWVAGARGMSTGGRVRDGLLGGIGKCVGGAGKSESERTEPVFGSVRGRGGSKDEGGTDDVVEA